MSEQGRWFAHLLSHGHRITACRAHLHVWREWLDGALIVGNVIISAQAMIVGAGDGCVRELSVGIDLLSPFAVGSSPVFCYYIVLQ